MDTSKDIREKIKDIVNDFGYDTDSEYGEIPFEKGLKEAVDSILQVFKEYIEAQQAYSVWPTTDPKDLKYLDKAQVLEGLEKEVI